MADETIEATDATNSNPSTSNTEKVDEYAVTDPSEVKIPDEKVDEAASEPVVFSPEILERAELLGVTEDQAREFPDEKSLMRTLNILDRQEREARAQIVTTNKTQSSAAKTEKLSLKLGELMDEDTKTAFTQLQDIINQQREELAANRELVESASKSSRESNIALVLDSEKDYESVVGPGHPRNRAKVLEYIDVLEAGYKARGKTPPSVPALVKQALSASFPNHQTKVTTTKAKAAVEKMNGQAISRPSQRNGQRSEPNAMQELRAIRERAAARG